MPTIDSASNQNTIQKIFEYFNKSDYLSLVNVSKEPVVQRLIEYSKLYDFYINTPQNSILNLRVFILIGIAYYNLGRYKEGNLYFNLCLSALNKLTELVDIFSAYKDVSKDASQAFKEYKQIEKNNSFLRPIIYAYIAHSEFKLNKHISSYKNYCNAYKISNKLSLKNKEHKSIYIDILLGRSDACYELTKKFITGIKIFFFLVFVIFMLVTYKKILFTVFFNLFDIVNPVLFCSCFIFGLMTFPKVLYKIFYFCLRKLRRFVSVNFLQLFSESFNNKLIDILNYINLKKFLSYKIHKEAIEKIENISQKDFNTFFAIAKLYYCLGEYKNSTLYIQRALSHHEEKNKSELAMAYHYLARIAYKTSNNLTAIDFYNKSIENLMNINKSDNEFKIEYLPSISDMIKYTQENRNKIEQTIFSRTYLPLIITLIITIFVSIAQIYCNMQDNQNKPARLFYKAQHSYGKLLTPVSKKISDKQNIYMR